MKQVFILLTFFGLISCHQKEEKAVRNISNKSKISLDKINQTSKLDTVAAVKRLLEDVDNLLKTRNPELLKDEIFGDCIYDQLDVEEPTPIHKNDVVRNFNRIFDSKFINEIREIKKNPHHEIYSSIQDVTDESIQLESGNYKYKYAVAINVIVEYGTYTRRYWFYYNEDNWIFKGISGVG